MFEFEQKYKRGRKTLFFIYLKHGWMFNITGIILLLLAWAVYYGPFYTSITNFLANHPNWYISTAMLSQWLILLAVASLVMALIEAHVIYAHYKFVLDDHAFNLHKGLFFVHETIIPYQQISNVNITRPYHYRLFGISQLDILTAADKGAMQSDEHKHNRKLLIPIIDASVARDLARQLMECASRKRKGLEVHKESPAIIEDEIDEEESDDEYVVENQTQKVDIQPVVDEEEVVPEHSGIPKEAGDDITVEAKDPSGENLYPTIDLRKL